MKARIYRAGFLACGLGAGARGFVEARGALGTSAAQFEIAGGVDIDLAGLEDFRTLTKGRTVVGDIHTMQPEDLVAAWGERRPDVVFSSTPCKGMSRLLGAKAAAREEYQALNRLTLEAFHLVCTTYVRTPVPLLLLENVPGLMSRGAELLAQIRALLAGFGYVFHESTHDCGELGGLGQHRRRFLLVARHAKTLPALLYQPPKQRVKACGEIIGPLPLPNDPKAGSLHVLPRISWINWVRLAMIPPGGDWRDLPRAQAHTAGDAHTNQLAVADFEQPSRTVTGATRPGAGADPRLTSPLAEGQARREVIRRHKVQAFDAPIPTVTGGGANAVENVADPRLGVNAWANKHASKYRVRPFGEPVGAVTGDTDVQEGAPNVADPRIPLTCAPRSGAYGVASAAQPLDTVTGSASIDNGTVAIADGRELRPLPAGYVVMTIDEALALATSPKGKPDAGVVPVIFSPHDGTWHRPLTTLELAALQGLPTTIDGAPLQLAGKSAAAHRERIGNAVPVGAARAIAEQMLRTLIAGALGMFRLSNELVWVRRARVPTMYVRRARSEAPAQQEAARG